MAKPQSSSKLLDILRRAEHSAALLVGCCSSVVERVIGNDEAGSSILPSSTIPSAYSLDVGGESHINVHARVGMAWGIVWIVKFTINPKIDNYRLSDNSLASNFACSNTVSVAKICISGG